MPQTSRWTHLEWAGLCVGGLRCFSPFLSPPAGPWFPCSRSSGWVVPTVTVFEGDCWGFSPWHLLAAGLGVCAGLTGRVICRQPLGLPAFSSAVPS